MASVASPGLNVLSEVGRKTEEDWIAARKVSKSTATPRGGPRGEQAGAPQPPNQAAQRGHQRHRHGRGHQGRSSGLRHNRYITSIARLLTVMYIWFVWTSTLTIRKYDHLQDLNYHLWLRRLVCSWKILRGITWAVMSCDAHLAWLQLSCQIYMKSY